MGKIGDFLCSEFRPAKLLFKVSGDERSSLAYSAWLPQRKRVQIVYVIYRWAVLLYFLAWLVLVCVDAATSEQGVKCLIYISYWGFFVWIAYLVVAAQSTSMTYLQMSDSYQCLGTSDRLVRGHGQHLNSKQEPIYKHSWRERLHWFLFVLGTETAVGISILFWALFHDTQDRELLFNPISLHIHFVNAVIAMLDLWVSSIPVCLSHAVYVVLFGLVYVAFTGIYYALNGVDPGGNHFIYPMLDYSSNPGAAIGFAIGCSLGYLTLVHLLFFILYLVREWLSNWIRKKCCGWGLAEFDVPVPSSDSDSNESYVELSNLV